MSRGRPRLLVIFAGVLVSLAALLAVLGALLRGPPTWNVPQRFDPRPVSAERLEQTVRTLCGEFVPRSYLKPDNLERAATWIAEQFTDAGLKVGEQPFSSREGRFRNILARREGSDPARGLIIIGAHYDAFADMPGADDNASGVAALIELARTLPERQPRRGQLFVAFANEEPPFFTTPDMGSYHLAKKLAEEQTDIELMIALDLIGYFSDEPGSQRTLFWPLGLYYPSRGNFIGIVGDTRAGRWIRQVKRGMRSARSLPVLSFRAPRAIPGVDWSDHFWFRELDLPGVLVTDTAMMRTPHYHSNSDTPDTLDYQRLAAVVQALHGVLQDE
ncbi:MAG: M28 family peptidase [Acidobacteriota bacterium]|nr:MAG: M28 family peptidase [Acidobacteriota bacterium]